tara:strand:- start:7601 stop:7864 length:264 start_codon:yes stop_codon:yes gene_type:complete
MAIRDDILKAARRGLGQGFEDADIAACKKEALRRFILPQLTALYKGRIRVDDTASQAAAEALAVETEARKAAEAEATAKAITDVGRI